MKRQVSMGGSALVAVLCITATAAAPASASVLWPDVGVGAWGLGTNGQLGNSASLSSTTPVATTVTPAMAGKVITDVSANSNFACAIASGTAFCWGQRSNGKLGDGNTSGSSNEPVAVTTSGVLSGKTMAKVSAGGNNSACALDTAGAAYCWGLGTSGQLGNGGTSNSSVPVAVTMPAGKTFTSIAVGNLHACASTADSLAYCWGLGTSGQLGNGGTSSSPTPVQVSSLTGVTSVSAGYQYSCAVSSGAGYCWGQQEGGKLGNNNLAEGTVSSPVAVDATGVLSGKTMTQISAGAQSGGTPNPGSQGSTCAVAGGQAYCWGFGGSGRLGNGASTSTPTAVKVSDAGVLSGKTIRTLSTGWNTACVTTTDYGLYCWGSNASGQLGTGGTPATSNVPVAVSTPDAFRVNFTAAGAARPVLAVSAGNAFATAAYGYAAQAGSPTVTYTEPTLQWSPPTYLGTSATTNYLLTYRLSSTPSAPFKTFMRVTSATTSLNVATYAASGCPPGGVCPRAYGPLTSGTAYDFQVSAVNSSGNGRNSAVKVVSWGP